MTWVNCPKCFTSIETRIAEDAALARADAAEADARQWKAEWDRQTKRYLNAESEVAELRHWRDIVACGRGCQCDPPGSGEEWCVGTCALREQVGRLEAVREAARDVLNMTDCFARSRLAAALAAAEGEGIADGEPDDVDNRERDKALHHDGKDILAPDEAAVKEGEPRRHQHDEACRDQHEGGVSVVECDGHPSGVAWEPGTRAARSKPPPGRGWRGWPICNLARGPSQDPGQWRRLPRARRTPGGARRVCAPWRPKS